MVTTATSTPSTFIVRPPPRSSSLRRTSNNNNRNNNNTSTETAPRAGWLSKLSQAYSIGNKKRWQTRFFVLLDTELRCYKNEHTQTPSCVINLRDTCQPVIMTSSSGSRPHCFRLEPISNDSGQSNNSRPLTIACQSAKELSDWVTAIQSILYKLNKHHHHQQDFCQKRTTKKFTPVAEQQQQQQQNNNIHYDDEESISRRRGILLPPLMVHPLDEIPTNVIVQSPVLSDTTISEDDDEDIIVEQEEAKITFVAGQRYMLKDNNDDDDNDNVDDNDNDNDDDAVTTLTRNDSTSTSPTGPDRRKVSAYSPTYLLYQERFHLFN